ncbi:MAG: 50S ribosomal protein L9 [Luteibaculaceae bacterium]
MEVILRQDIANLGFKDEAVTVKPGYARNYLIPQGMAILATPSAKKMLAETLKQRSHKEAKIKEEAQAKAEAMGKVTVTIGAKASENGKIFGSVNNIQIAEVFAKAGIEVDRRQIIIKDSDAIKMVGKYNAIAKLHKEVTVEFEFEVVSE